MFEEIFHRKKLIPQKLLDFGFTKGADEKSFTYETEIMQGEFLLLICIEARESQKPLFSIETRVTEKSTGEEYILYKTRATGSFVGEVRSAIEGVLREVAEKCAVMSVFAFPQTERVIDYVRQKYGDELEFLWEKFDDNAIFRRKDSQKWYGAVLTTSRKKLGLKTDELVEIIDLRISPEKMESLLKNGAYYPGWHMNKKHWFSVILDGSVSDEELFARIDESYALAGKNKK